MFPMGMMADPNMMANYWQSWTKPGPDQESSGEDGEVSDSEVETGDADDSPMKCNAKVSLGKHVAALNTNEDEGPDVSKELASLMEKLWARSHKEEIKDLYLANKRPANTPSFQKVTLDMGNSMGKLNKTTRTCSRFTMPS